MSFWSDKLNEMKPAATRAQPLPVSGAWWQQPQDRPVQPPVVTHEPQQYQPTGYAPAKAQHLYAEECCPRCGSEEYASVPVDLSFGGRGGMAETGFNMSQPKQCFDCRYPSRDPSGDIVRGKGAVRTGVKAQRRDVVQVGGGEVGSWGGKASWDAAQLIA